MRIVVQKFGGTSVATATTRELVVSKVKIALQQGLSSVVVVSAMGRKGDCYATDTLIGLARGANPTIAMRELDQIMYCGEMISGVIMAGTLQAAGIEATMLTGGQAGVITDSNFNSARILKVDPARIMTLLRVGKIPVVCGFQGMSIDGEFTTLGRGGSDTTASALGVALNAELVEIYTDVEGIMTADPRMVSNAKILDCVSYGEVCQLAHQGAKVIHPRAVEIVMKKNIPLVVKSTFTDAPGTLVTNFPVETGADEEISDRIATGVTYIGDISHIKVKIDDDRGANSKVFKTMAAKGISVDLINVHPGQIMFTVSAENTEEAVRNIQRCGYEVEAVRECAKVSVVGGGMREVPGVMATFVEALSENSIAILQTVDSHTSISALVKKADIQIAITALHEKFGLSN